jgi:hypothetical protein
MPQGRAKAFLWGDREALASPASCIEFRLVGQAFDWGEGPFDDRTGSENLAK